MLYCTKDIFSGSVRLRREKTETFKYPKKMETQTYTHIYILYYVLHTPVAMSVVTPLIFILPLLVSLAQTRRAYNTRNKNKNPKKEK